MKNLILAALFLITSSVNAQHFTEPKTNHLQTYSMYFPYKHLQEEALICNYTTDKDINKLFLIISEEKRTYDLYGDKDFLTAYEAQCEDNLTISYWIVNRESVHKHKIIFAFVTSNKTVSLKEHRDMFMTACEIFNNAYNSEYDGK